MTAETRKARAGKGNQAGPSPALLFDTINAYQKTAMIKTAIELDVFTALAQPASADAVAVQCRASARGIRILCDALTVLGFLTKSGERYALTPDSAVFLNRKSPAYAGGTLEFLLSNDLRAAFDQLTESVRKGGTAQSRRGTMEPEHPVWLSFARTMGPLMVPAAAGLAELIPLDAKRASKVLDISASHGAWGLAFAKKHPKAQIYAVDWAPVLEIARAAADSGGVGDRFHTIPGSAFTVKFGRDFDAVLIPNFLHHFNADECATFLKKVHTALRPGGTVAIVEFVPNADRISPPTAAAFSLVMLASTAEGDAYTFDEYAEMLKESGFNLPAAHSLPASMNVAVIATRK